MATAVVFIELPDDELYGDDRGPQDLAEALTARLEDECGYAVNGTPYLPSSVSVGIFPAGFDGEILSDILDHAAFRDSSRERG